VGEIKVTDKRMFTPDGRLREEYERELARAPVEPDDGPADEPAVAPAPAAPEPPPEAPQPASPAPFALPSGAPAKPPVGLLELIQILGELAAGCLGQAPLPDGRLTLDLDGARFYIDLVASLIERFGPAFPAQDRRALDTFLDQLRLQYVARQG
jgi:hypothetical protein